MRRNRMLLYLFIILTGIFVSYYGGYVSYGLFFFSLSIPIVSYIYLIYVYLRFRIYQFIEHKTMVKGEHISYQFLLTNEDYMTFSNVNVSFKSDYSTVENISSDRSYCLLPGEKIEQATTICCHYRGEYRIGIDKVTVTDYLNLFHLVYNAPSAIQAKVLPRIIRLNSLKLYKETEGKTLELNPVLNQNVPDVEIRRYEPGDEPKRIHWKASAKLKTLVTRKYTQEPKTEVYLYVDFEKKNSDEVSRVILEDKIIETALALCDFFYRCNTPVRVIYDIAGIKILNISGKQDFDQFYQLCTDVYFRARHSISSLLMESCNLLKNTSFSIILTHTFSEDIVKASYHMVSLGNEVAILYFGEDDVSKLSIKLDSRIYFQQIIPNQEISEVLEG
ncbi:protein of unknown function DUF58 [Lachnoclostridium phytofermentans ISDg]|uniref:DUF58 domain-containing protein n=2 Tax=Lachnoclostridium phytofermentans TaxID=66219 RepID=A9KT88_LACP7|nr:protein of unknown function DUF58 [Lachnoclostridium phytofermentans ISDg]